MSKQDNSEVSADLAKARNATGIEEGAEIPKGGSDIEESELEEGESGSEKSKSSKSSEEDEDENEDSEDDEESSDDKEKSDSKPKSQAKNRSPLKAAFKQIGELQKGQKATISALTDLASAIKDLKTAGTTVEKKEATESLEDLLAKVTAQKGDANLIAKIAEAIADKKTGSLLKEIEDLKKTLSKTEKSTSELTAKEQAEARLKLESSAFGGEWNQFSADLKKSYPNATEEMLNDAKAEMRKLATSKAYGGESLDGTENKGKEPMPLDYILFREKQKFDALLRVKSGRSGQNGGSDMNDDEDDGEEISLDPENMTPAKLKKYEARKRKMNEKDGKLPIEIIG